MGWDVPWYSVGESADVLRAGRDFNHFMLVCYLRRGDKVFETYWTSGRGVEGMAPTLRTNGRPTAQWPRLEAGRSDDLRPKPDR